MATGKAKTKREIIQEKINENIEDIYKMEMVRDYNKMIVETETDAKKVNEAKIQVSASVQQIMKDQDNIKFLEEYIKTCDEKEIKPKKLKKDKEDTKPAE